MTTPERDDNRELLVTYLGGQGPEVVLDGVTTDHGILMIYNNIIARESDAWLLRKLGLLPDWWRLATAVHVRHLSEFRDTYTHPEALAQRRLADLTEAGREELRYGWRVYQSGGGPRITRRADNRQPLQANSALLGSLNRVPRPVLGAHKPWPNVEIEPVLVDSR